MSVGLLTIDKQKEYAKQGWLVSDNSATLLDRAGTGFEELPINPFYRTHVICSQCDEPAYIRARRKAGDASTITYGFSCTKCNSAFIQSFDYDRYASVPQRCEVMCAASGGAFFIK